MSKPAAPSTQTLVPALLDQYDPAGLPCVDRRGDHHLRRITLGHVNGRVGVRIEAAGTISPDELITVSAELAAMRLAARAEQAHLDAEDAHAAEVERLARDTAPEDLSGLLVSAERAQDVATIALALEAIERQDGYATEARVAAFEAEQVA